MAQKRAWIKRQVEDEIGPPESFDECRWSLIGPADPHGTFEEATAWLVLTVRDRDRAKVNRSSFSSRVVSIATSSVPGFYLTTPPQSERLFGVQWPTLIAKDLVTSRVVTGGGETIARALARRLSRTPATIRSLSRSASSHVDGRPTSRPSRRRSGRSSGTRSGDKAGSANLGAWARDDQTYAWLASYLTVDAPAAADAGAGGAHGSSGTCSPTCGA